MQSSVAICKVLTADAVENYLKVTTAQIEDFEITYLRFNVWDKKLKRTLLRLINSFVSIDIYYFYFKFYPPLLVMILTYVMKKIMYHYFPKANFKIYKFQQVNRVSDSYQQKS